MDETSHATRNHGKSARMVDDSAILDRPLPDRRGESAHGGRPMAVENPLHGDFVEASKQPREEGELKAMSTSERKLGNCRTSDSTQPAGKCQTASPNADLGALGSAKIEANLQVYQARQPMNRLRPSECVRLLNSTPLGTVTSERQLFRHRAEAGYRIGEQRSVDLIRYAAWLAFERHKPASARVRKEQVPEVAPPEGRAISKRDVLDLLESQAYCCALTGWELTPHTASLDHRLPVSRGGEHTVANAQVLHEDVNRAKGTLTNEEFIKLCRAVVQRAHRVKSQPKPPSNKDQA